MKEFGANEELLALIIVRLKFPFISFSLELT